MFIGSRFDQYEEALLLWALYPLNKRAKIIDVDKVFGHMMKFKVEEIDPIVSANIGVDISKFNRAQIIRTVREINQCKELYEETIRRSGQSMSMILFPDNLKWEKKCEELQQENQRILKQMWNVRVDTASFLLNKRFENLKGYLEGFWVLFQKNMDNAISHNMIKNRLGTRLHDKTLAGIDAK